MDPNSRRKRATIACTLCRKRKRRCDGASPSCQLCLDSGVACTYPIPEETVSKEDRLLEPIASRLDLLEESLRRQTTLLEALNDRGQCGGGDGPSMPTEHQTTSPLSCRLSAATSTPRPHERGSQTSQQADSDPLHVDAGTTPPPMTIPVGHCTTTASLLSLDVVKAILGDFPDDVFVRTEERRRMPPEMRLHGPPISIEDLPPLDPLQAEGLVESYFDYSHGEAPILDRVEIFELHHRLQQTCLGLDVESALYLSVLALGCAFGSHAAPRIHGSSPAPGVEYFVPALRILVPEYLESYGSSVMLSQGLLLAARYFAFFLCPLQSWKLVHMASTDIQHQFSRPDREYGSGEVGPETSMTVWAIFDMECNLIAEHQFPHSGIEHIVDRMELPGSQAGGDHESHTMLNWLAELAVRRLLNRVHHTMYGRDAMKRFAPKLPSTGSRSMAAVLNLSSELNQQLDVWFQTLPPIIRPNLANTEGRGPLELHLLHRYHSAKDIIFRPFVFFVYSAPEHTELPDLVLERAGTCLRHCRSYLAVAERILPLPSTSREIIMHSVLSATIMLTLGALSPPLTPLVEDIRDMQDTAISCLSPFAYPGSSVETMSWILQTLATKTHVLRNTLRKRVRRSSVSS